RSFWCVMTIRACWASAPRATAQAIERLLATPTTRPTESARDVSDISSFLVKAERARSSGRAARHACGGDTRRLPPRRRRLPAAGAVLAVLLAAFPFGSPPRARWGGACG